MLKILLIVCLLLLQNGNTEKQRLPSTFQANVIAVKDGDTIEVLYNGKSLAIRFEHIDCPEIRKGQPFGKAAKQFTSDMCFGQIISVQNRNKFDRYKRLIAVVIDSEGENVNKALVKAGLAWHFKKYSSDITYAALEQEAREHRCGLWKEKGPIPPWDWRRRK